MPPIDDNGSNAPQLNRSSSLANFPKADIELACAKRQRCRTGLSTRRSPAHQPCRF